MSVQLTDNAISLLNARYLRKDETGTVIETPDEMFHRVARAVAQGDPDLEHQFYTAMSSLDFLPNSPTLMNAGLDSGTLSACFCLGVPDSMEGIFTAIKNSALVSQSGGGCGFNFSYIRPKGSPVRGVPEVASGPVSFMKVFDAATDAVKQSSRRRGANMGLMSVHHPDILDFITCKSEDRTISNFNISVGLTEEFMAALREDSNYHLYDLNTGDTVGSLSATHVFDTLVEHAWKNGEPGVAFLDEIEKYNVVPSLGKLENLNPCGRWPQ
jgi:ribonucleoside-diphosphate reductase alpha chain